MFSSLSLYAATDLVMMVQPTIFIIFIIKNNLCHPYEYTHLIVDSLLANKKKQQRLKRE